MISTGPAKIAGFKDVQVSCARNWYLWSIVLAITAKRCKGGVPPAEISACHVETPNFMFDFSGVYLSALSSLILLYLIVDLRSVSAFWIND